MKIEKAVVTAAGRGQRTLALQALVDRDGVRKTALGILLDEVLACGVEEVGIVIRPGDEAAYREAAGTHADRLVFVVQDEPLGYGHALAKSADFVGDAPFLHVVNDHLCLSSTATPCSEQLVRIAVEEGCAVSAVQATREHRIGQYGTVGGRRQPGRDDLYVIERVIEKPTPTEAEQRLVVPGLRDSEYLCFFGLHVLTPTILDRLKILITTPGNEGASLSDALDDTAHKERYLALEIDGSRHDLGRRYGLLEAQLALALDGRDRDVVLSELLELLARRELARGFDGEDA